MRERKQLAHSSGKNSLWEQLTEGEILPPEEGRVVSHFGFNVEVEDGMGLRFRCAVRETAGDEPVCGDLVQWSRSGGDLRQGVIWSIFARKNSLQRPAFGGNVQTVAANIDLLMVTLAADKPNLGLLDRYLIAAEANAMEPVIVINKMDRISPQTVMDEMFRPYVEMRYKVCYVSAYTGQGMTELEKLLVNNISIFSGHSGVGKSSIISRWVQNEEKPAIGEFRDLSDQGRHTTTVARMYHLPVGGRLIDSPGIREFGLINIPKASLASYFRDVVANAPPCRFADCSHAHEPGCGVKEAVLAGRISQKRYDSMMRIFYSL